MSIRVKTTLIIISTLVIGMAIGALITGAVIKHRVDAISELPPAERFVYVLDRLIGPDEANRDTIAAVLQKHSGRFVEIRHGHLLQMAALIDSVRRDLAPVLTEEQAERFNTRLEYLKQLVGEP